MVEANGFPDPDSEKLSKATDAELRRKIFFTGMWPGGYAETRVLAEEAKRRGWDLDDCMRPLRLGSFTVMFVAVLIIGLIFAAIFAISP